MEIKPATLGYRDDVPPNRGTRPGLASEFEPRSSDFNLDLISFLPLFTTPLCVSGHRLRCIIGDASTHLLVLQLDSDDPEGAAGSVVVDVDPAEPLLAGFDWSPFLAGVIVDHHGSPGLADTLFAAEQEKIQVSASGTRAGSRLCPFLKSEANCSLTQRNFLTARAFNCLWKGCCEVMSLHCPKTTGSGVFCAKKIFFEDRGEGRRREGEKHQCVVAS